MASNINGISGYIVEVGDLDLSNVTNMYGRFSNAINLRKVGSLYNAENITDCSYLFQNCPNLNNIDLSNMTTSNMRTCQYMFTGCTSLTSIEFGQMFTLASVETNGILYMFQNCSNLNNNSLNNILKLCTTAINLPRTYKTLKWLGLSQTQATTCQGLSNYQDFLDAGWTTGY